MALKKTYDPAAIEARWYDHWEKSGAFKPADEPQGDPYVIVIPPPNVTGSLHIGHALDNTLQDVLIRFERMRGRDVLWQPGVDHAGIATQMVVERQLDEEGINRRDLGREKFLERVWQTKEESGGTITRQLRRLGASCDWSRERFTMDDAYQAAVTRKFVKLYEDGLIYRDKRLVNWDPKLLTAISDLEVEQKEVDGHFWHIRYPVEGEDGRFITIATTRPETMLADAAVAVHPDDERYADLVGKHAILPLAGRRLPIVADEWADPEQGSGAVKITPAHDFNDFAVGQRHGLPLINVMDEHAAIAGEHAPEKYRGMDRYEARKAIVADLEEQGYLVKVEPHRHSVPVGDRSGVVIEPWLTDQWFVDAETMARPAIEAVESGTIKFVPKTWEKTYFNWMRNIQPWCVSRQLWWGHRIPAWYTPDGDYYVAETEEEARAKAEADHGKGIELAQDEDVLDTWFSSAMWPFATQGWPADTPDLKRFYPGSTLVTGFDIIFFWVARMIMDGLHFMGEVPFRTVYIHSLIRDAEGQKMSKSRGNVVDPLTIIEKYGADALRFTLAAQESQGRDMKLAEDRIEGYRNFGTKLWNACRFAEMNGAVGAQAGFDPAKAQSPLSRWIITETQEAIDAVTGALDTFRFNEAADAIYHFTWHTVCDWYVELAKPVLQGDDGTVKDEAQAVLAWVMDQVLRLLHPFMPFITEELWHAMAGSRETDLIRTPWPAADAALRDADARDEYNWVIRLITVIRSVRGDLNVPAGAKVEAGVAVKQGHKSWLERNRGLIERLARLKRLHDGAAEGEGIVRTPLADGEDLALNLAGVIDLDAERARLKKEIGRAEDEVRTFEKKLANTNFTEKAPTRVVEEAREKLAAHRQTRDKLQAALKRLG